MYTEEANPNPEYLIKSIAEQGYSLETALADLIDNSVAANADRVEILTDYDNTPFTLFLADNGDGMTGNQLKASMKFPSESPENIRAQEDLGRFGLGMKTASFSQTRRFTVLSKKKGTNTFEGCTWDVNYLKEKHSWLMIINSATEISNLLSKYKKLSVEHLNCFIDFEPNTIVVWNGLYKFEDYLESSDKQGALIREISTVTVDYLSLVFHRFMVKKNSPLQIRVNNKQLMPFNPFPTDQIDMRSMEYKTKPFKEDFIKIEGFILPSRSIEESLQGSSIWTTRNKGLMDMEGIYIYRADRVIIFGGWNGLIKKAPRLQLARLRVDVGNSVDHLLHLNVAKSQVAIPHDLQKGFEHYIEELKTEAEREFYNRGVRKYSIKGKDRKATLFERRPSSKGTLLEINREYPLIKSLIRELPKEKQSLLNVLLRMINTTVNEIRKTHEDKGSIDIDETLSPYDISTTIKNLREAGMSLEAIKSDVLSHLGYNINSLPENIIEILAENK